MLKYLSCIVILLKHGKGGNKILTQTETIPEEIQEVKVITHRKTTILFENTTELSKYAVTFGISARKERSCAIYKLNNKMIYDSGIGKELEKYPGVPVEKYFDYWTELETYDIARFLEKFFEIPEYTTYVRTSSIEIETTDYTQFAHKTLVRKVYRDAQKKGFKVNHECETSVTKENCLK